MNFKHYRGDSYDFSWTYLLAEEFKKYSSNSIESCLHYGISLLKNKNFDEILSKFRLNFYIEEGDFSLLFDQNWSVYLKNLKKFDLVFCTSRPIYNFFISNKIKSSLMPIGIPTLSEPYRTFFNKYIGYENKKNDLIYSGGIYNKFFFDILTSIKRHKYIYSSYYKPRIFPKYTLNPFYIKRNYYENFNNLLYTQIKSKIGFLINQLSINQKQYIKLKKNIGYSSINNFDYINENLLLPQFKGRMWELASTKTLILVKKDPWNIIEETFLPNSDFIYYNNIDEANDIIDDVIINYKKYHDITESAYNRVKKLTSIKLFRYIENFSKKIKPSK